MDFGFLSSWEFFFFFVGGWGDFGSWVLGVGAGAGVGIFFTNVDFGVVCFEDFGFLKKFRFLFTMIGYWFGNWIFDVLLFHLTFFMNS